MTLVEDSAGHFNVSPDAIMTETRKPVFVDNAVHYSLINPQTSNKQKVTIENRKNATYHIASNSSYEIVENNSTLEITHSERAGHRYENAPWYENSKLSSISDKRILIYGKEKQKERLQLNSFETHTRGIKANLSNMQGKTLQDIGFTGNEVYLGQPVDIGLRTTDYALQLTKEITSDVTSVNIAMPRTITNATSTRRKHSTSFLAEDVKNIPILSALKFVSRHDNRVVYFDRFGNIIYVPFNFSDASRMVKSSLRQGTERTNPVDSVVNRVTVAGIPLALNSNVEVTVDDGSRQQGKFDSFIQSTNTPVFDSSIKTERAARRVARQILKATALMKGAIETDGHPNSWDLRPGNLVTYKGKKYAIMEAEHSFNSNLSNFKFLALDVGLEGAIQGVSEGFVAEGNLSNKDTTIQIQKEDLSLFDELDISFFTVVKTRDVSNSGYIIGKNAGRSLPGIGKESLGTAKKKVISFTEDLDVGF